MTDEQYIQELVEKGFEQSEINQLLKIYVYTKKHNFVLKNINTEIDTDILRNIAKFLKNNKLSKLYFEILNDGQTNNCDIIPYLLNQYDTENLSLLIDLEQKGYVINNLKNSKFKTKQLIYLKNCIEDGIEGVNEYCANPNYSLEKMNKIITGLNAYIILENHIDIDLYSKKQCEAIVDILLNYGKNPLVNMKEIKNPNYSPNIMYYIADLMSLNLPYKQLMNEKYSEEFREILYDAIKKGIDIKKIEELSLNEKNLSLKQMKTILEIIKDKNYNPKKYDYNKIFNKNNNYLKIRIYHDLIVNNEIEFINKIIDKNYNIEQIVDLYNLYKLNINNIKDTTPELLHIYRREKELYEQGKNIDNYLKLATNSNQDNKKSPKYKIEMDYSDEHYFITEDNCILQIEQDDMYWKDIFGEVSEEEPSYIEHLKRYKEEIIEVLKNRFILVVNEEKETIELYDIIKQKIIQQDIDKYQPMLNFNEEQIYQDMYDAILDNFGYYELMKNKDTLFESVFEYIEDLIDNVPNFSNELKFFRFGDMAQTWYYIVTKKDIEDKYGEINSDTLKLANKEYKDTCIYLEAQSDCKIYKCKKYNLNSELIKEISGYYGDNIIEKIENDFGIIKQDLGLQKDLTTAKNKYINNIEEER